MPRGVYVRTEAYRQKQREAMARHENPGRNKSPETKKKIGDAQRGKPKSEQFRRKLSEHMKGKPSFWKGKKHSTEFSALMSAVHGGANHHNWKGGISSEHSKIRASGEYARWRKAVLARDNYTCKLCGVRGGHLNADHIKPFAAYPDLRFCLENGRTLCVPCHKTTETYGGKYRLWEAENIGGDVS